MNLTSLNDDTHGAAPAVRALIANWQLQLACLAAFTRGV